MDKTISPKLQPVELSDGKTQQTVKPGQPMLTAPQALSEAGEMKMRLDSVITKDANGNNSMLQYFVYNDKGKEIKRENSQPFSGGDRFSARSPAKMAHIPGSTAAGTATHIFTRRARLPFGRYD